MAKITYLPGEVVNASVDENGNRLPVTRTQHIFDDTMNKPQSQVNEETAEAISDEVTRAQNAESGLDTRLHTVEELAEISVGGGDIGIGTAADFESDDPEDLAKVPTVGAMLGGANDGVYDISARHSGTKYADLAAALGTNGINVPVGVRKGGMSVKFVQSSDNKYVQYRLMPDEWSTTVSDWQGVDDEPIAGSDNLVKSGGVKDAIDNMPEFRIISNADFSLNGFINKGTGERNTLPNRPDFICTDYIEVSEGYKIDYSLSFGGAAVLAFYDENKNYLSTYSVIGTGILNGVVSVPVDAKYIRACNSTTANPDAKALVLFNYTDKIKALEKDIDLTRSFDFPLNGFINKDTGAFVERDDEWFTCTDFCEVKNGEVLNYKLAFSGAAYLAFYDEDHSYMIDVSLKGTEGATSTGNIVVPYGAKYVRACNAYNINKTPILQIVNLNKLKGEVSNILNSIDVLNYEFVVNGFINKDSGALVSRPDNPNLLCTDYCPVTPGDVLHYSLCFNGAAYLAFYDENKAYMTDESLKGTSADVSTGNIIVPAKARYIRACNAYNVYKTPLIQNLNAANVKKSIFVINSNISELNKQTDKINCKYQLQSSINKPIVFSGKSIAAFGDSITHGYASSPSGATTVDSYIVRVASHLSATIINYAVNNAHFTDLTGIEAKTIEEQLDDAVGTSPDIVWVSAGINDFAHNAPIGTLSDQVNTTFYGALNVVAVKIKQMFPNAVVFFMTPIPITEYRSAQSALSLNAFRTAIYEIATLNGFNVISGIMLGMPQIPNAWGREIVYDGVHPTDLGHSLLARNVVNAIL